MARKSVLTEAIQRDAYRVLESLCEGVSSCRTANLGSASAAKNTLAALQKISETAKLTGTSIAVPEASVEASLWGVISNMAYTMQNAPAAMQLQRKDVMKMASAYATICAQWGCTPTASPERNGAGGLRFRVPRFYIPMDCPYPDPQGIPCGPFDLDVLFYTTGWNIRLARCTGSIESANGDGRVHPHQYQGDAFCRGNWDGTLRTAERSWDLNAFIETLTDAFLMRSSSTRYAIGHGGGWCYSKWVSCPACSAVVSNSNARCNLPAVDNLNRGGMQQYSGCTRCGAMPVFCAPCSSMATRTPTYAVNSARCTPCHCQELWGAAVKDRTLDAYSGAITEAYYAGCGPLTDIPPCDMCGTAAKSRPRCPAALHDKAKKKYDYYWSCSQCWQPEFKLTAWHNMPRHKKDA